jgi:protocatechuate 4,5-dioxygenase alpha subunit
MPYAPEYLHLVFPGVTFEAFLYGRNSDDAIGQGNSVGDQLAIGRSLCDRFNWRITREFNDTDISASRHTNRQRGDFEALLELGGNIFFVLKLAALDGRPTQSVAASFSGQSTEEYAAMMRSGGRSPEGIRSISGGF